MFEIDLDYVKSYLGYTDTTRDVQLQVLMDAGFAALKSVLGRNLEYGLYMDTFQYRTWKLYLTEYPVESIVSVASGASVIDPSEYKLFLNSGLMVFPCWMSFRGPNWLLDSDYIYVTYVGGYVELPGDLKLALLNAIQSADQLQQQNATFGGPVKRLSVYDVGVTDLAVPRDGSVTTLTSSLEQSLSAYVERAGSLAGWMVHESEYLGTAPGSP